MIRHLYANTGLLSRLVLRQDRVRLPIWLLALIGATLLVVNAFATLYSSQPKRQSMADTMMNPAMTAMVGPAYGIENYTIGAMLAHQMLLFTAVVVGIMNILLITRHTRAEEEDGRVELVRALPSGKLSNVTAAITVISGANVLLGLLTALGLIAMGVDSIGVEGSFLYGLSLSATGIFFAGLTAVFAQLCETARSAIGWSMAVLLIAYMTRAIGDVSSEALSWTSPFGWIVRTETFVNNIWGPVLLTFGAGVVLIGLTFYLNSIRDVEAGFLPSKPGRKKASPLLLSRIGLPFRLQRTALISWAVGMLVLGASYGSVLGDLESYFSEIEIMQEMLAQVKGVSMTEQFLTMLMAVLAMISTIFPMMAVLKLKGEENKGRTEHVLGRAISRNRLLGSYLVLAVFFSFLMVSLSAIGLGGAGISVMEDGLSFSTFYNSAVVYLPAMWVMLSVCVLIIGWAPRLSGLAWLYLIYSFIVVYLGSLFQFEEWVEKLTPFGHIPDMPVEDVSWPVLAALTAIAVVVTTIGFIGYNKRDIHG
ncbi:ABC transporter permease [Thalassobacillus pellis]|uniref:ABC transporter permease n=1 Tax=Thalassobacillus pellis TaxID=748008 RepID=UPI0019614E3F|nr:ABC transporter permease [Thalassobacillus pellis]MBM7553126.1 ABC-2 type transport system permease protein [Thalassobacillus pellis]